MNSTLQRLVFIFTLTVWRLKSILWLPIEEMRFIWSLQLSIHGAYSAIGGLYAMHAIHLGCQQIRWWIPIANKLYQCFEGSRGVSMATSINRRVIWAPSETFLMTATSSNSVSSMKMGPPQNSTFCQWSITKPIMRIYHTCCRFRNSTWRKKCRCWWFLSENAMLIPHASDPL